MLHIPYRLGIDIGKVIIDSDKNDGTDTSFMSDNFLRTTAVPDAFDAIQRLVTRFGRDHVYIVSKCGTRVQEKSLAWFKDKRFFEQTEVNPNNVRFCRQRNEKAGICRGLDITHFVDDRAEILTSMQGIVTHRYVFNPSDKEMKRFAEYMNGEQVVLSWTELEPLILATIR